MAFPYRIAICALFRNEAKYLREWIEYHRMVGIERFYLFDNRSTDHPETVLDPYLQQGIVVLHQYTKDLATTTAPHLDPDYPYAVCLRQYRDEAQWIAFIDLDEYIIFQSKFTLDKLLNRIEGSAGVLINWILFGPGSHYEEPKGLVLESYILRAPNHAKVNEHVKCIADPRKVACFAIAHYPTLLSGKLVRPDGTPCEPNSFQSVQANEVVLHHYAYKSKEFWLCNKMVRVVSAEKIRTPKVNTHAKNPPGTVGSMYDNVLFWEEFNQLENNVVQDETALALLPELRDRLGKEPVPIKHEYITLEHYEKQPGVREYIENNINEFKGNRLDAAYHYWLLFDNMRPVPKQTVTIDQDRYRDLPRVLSDAFGVRREECGAEVLHHFHMTCEKTLPKGFDWKYYAEVNVDLAGLNELEAILHWHRYGYKESRIYKRKVHRLAIYDGIFPMIYGRWRTVEINHFLLHPSFETDVYIPIFMLEWIRTYIGIDLLTCFDQYYSIYPHLQDYNILIFNPSYNALNKYNRNVDGTAFNHKYPGDFLFTKRDIPDWNYDVTYSIFLETRFYARIIQQPSIVRIYPGGGYIDNPEVMNQLRSIASEEIITTQPFITERVKQICSHVTEIKGVPLLSHDLPPWDKPTNPDVLHVCYTSLVYVSAKGYDRYFELARQVNDPRIHFHAAGVSARADAPPNITFHGLLTPSQLDALFRDMDVIVSPNRKERAPDGFPLGGEALIWGCIPVLSDPYDMNKFYGFEGLIMQDFDLEVTKEFLLMLLNNVDKRRELQRKNQEIARRIFSPSVQLEPVEKVFSRAIALKQMKTMLDAVPGDYGGGCPVDKAEIMARSIIDNNFTCVVDIGVWKGRSLISLAMGTLVTKGRAYGIDPYTRENMLENDAPNHVMQTLPSFASGVSWEEVYRGVKQLFASYPHVAIVRKTAEDAVGDIPEPIDLLHIDGNHDRIFVEKDIRLYVPKVKEGGWIVMDDTDWDSVRACLPLLANFATLKHDYGAWQVWYKVLKGSLPEAQPNYKPTLISTDRLVEYYQRAYATPSDIHEHVTILAEYARMCESVVECVMTNMTGSWGLAYGLAHNGLPRKLLTCVDLNYSSEMNILRDVCIGTEIEFRFIQGNNIKLELPERDLLFIDTWHVYGHMRRELALHADKTKKYIIMHDTTVDATVGESVRMGYDIKRQVLESGYAEEEVRMGIWPAVEEFLDSHPEWSLEHRYDHCNGLTILVRK